MSRFGLKTNAAALLALAFVMWQAADTVDLALTFPLARGLNGGPGFGGEDYVCSDCNVILISIDTLRQDHVGAYGYRRDTTPNIDRFAADAVRFDDAIAHAPSTLPSHASILTSLLPEQHRAFRSADLPLPDEAVTMAEILWQSGFRTGAYTAGAQMHNKYNLDQGFDVWNNFEGDMTHKSRFFDTLASAEPFLEEYGNEQFFLMLHTYEVHTPYTPPIEYLRMFDPDYDGELDDEIGVDYLRSAFENPSGMSAADREHIVAAYDGEIRHMDDAFGALIDDLKTRGIYDQSMIIFTSDHGEEFGERGRMGWHSYTLYDELLKVPLLVKFPHSQYAGGTVEEIARGIDILPTVVDVLGIETETAFQGTSLLDRLLNRRSDGVFAVSQIDFTDGPLPSSIRTKRWKLLDGALYDLAADPMELDDVSGVYPHVMAGLELNLAALRSTAALANAEPVEMNPELRRQLRAMGYIQ